MEGPGVRIEGSPDVERTWTVSGLLGRLGDLLDEQPDLLDLTLRAEITNWTRARSGHCYFSLKDDQAQVRCVMFQGEARHLDFEPADGVAVRAQGRVTLYRPRGELQLRIRRLRADGVGALYEALERLRRRLETEGLFGQDRKRPLPTHPRVVGVVTSKQGAVLHDICTTLAPQESNGADPPGRPHRSRARAPKPGWFRLWKTCSNSRRWIASSWPAVGVPWRTSWPSTRRSSFERWPGAASRWCPRSDTRPT